MKKIEKIISLVHIANYAKEIIMILIIIDLDVEDVKFQIIWRKIVGIGRKMELNFSKKCDSTNQLFYSCVEYSTRVT